MAFFQTPPHLGNQFDDDPLLRELLERTLGGELAPLEAELRHLGDLAGGDLYRMQQEDRLNEPRLVQWDAWGNRVDRVELTPLWRHAAVLAAEHGLVAVAYEKKLGERSRLHHFALNYVLDASLDVYSCPLAMTDGAARTLQAAGNQALIDRALPRLTSRDPARMWTSGQWMTERTGGSDVGLSETVARPTTDPSVFRLYGTKWFTSAITADMALTLARPEGNVAGSAGLALFYVELRDAEGRLDGLEVNRLKDKLGTRKVPTAELTLDGIHATPVIGTAHGVRHITPMLTVTRTWNAIGAVSGMRRALALARDYSGRRHAFGAVLAEKPLHVDTLAGLAAELEGAFVLTARAAQLLGRDDCGVASEAELRLLRLITPLCKLATAKQAVAVASEALECFGGAGYVEDTGLPRILRDAQVLPIWEGTTNVLSLDALRALGADGTLAAFNAEVTRCLGGARDGTLKPCVEAVQRALFHAQAWVTAAFADANQRQAGARRFALTLARSLELALLVDHAQWCFDHGRGPRASLAARRLAKHGVDLISDDDGDDLRLLALGR